MRRILVALSIVSLMPTASAESGLVLGTEDLPELPDDVDDVQYDPLYQGPRDQDYIDLAAAWFSYDETTDRITLHMKMADTRALEEGPEGWWPSCLIEGAMMAQEQQNGFLAFRWSHYPNGTQFHSVSYDPEKSMPAGASDSTRGYPIDHTFSEARGAPGYFGWTVERGPIAQVGEFLTRPRAVCQNLYSPLSENPAGGPRVIGSGLAPIYTNMDRAESESSFSVMDLVPAGAADPSDPWEASSSSSPEPTATSFAERAASIPVALIVLGLMSAMVFARRSKQP